MCYFHLYPCLKHHPLPVLNVGHGAIAGQCITSPAPTCTRMGEASELRIPIMWEGSLWDFRHAQISSFSRMWGTRRMERSASQDGKVPRGVCPFLGHRVGVPGVLSD